MKFDDLLVYLGEFGPFQKRVYFLVCLTCVLHGMRMVALVFLLNTPQHRCAIPGYVNDSYDVKSPEHDVMVSMWIPEDDDCHVYASGNYSYDSNHRPLNATVVECDRWVYDTSVFLETVTSQFDLVCRDKLKKSHATMVFYGGFLIGVFVLGAVSDIIGRKLCLYLSLGLLLILGTALAFASSFLMFAVLNFFVGAATTGIFSSAFVIGIELVGLSKRKYTGMLIHLFFSTGVVGIALLAYLIRDWYILEMVITLPMALFFCIWCLIPESPRWQIQRGRFSDARRTVEWAARVNKTTVPDHAMDAVMPLVSNNENGHTSLNGHSPINGHATTDRKGSGDAEEGSLIRHNGGLEDGKNGVTERWMQNGGRTDAEKKEEEEQKGRLVDLFTSKVLAVRTSIIFLNWMVVSMAFYTLNFNVGNLGTGSIFLNFFFIGLAEYPAHIITIFTVDRVGRKVVHCGMMFISGVSCLMAVLSILLVSSDHQWLTVTLVMLGKFGAAGGFGTIYMYSTEIYPTVIRNSALGASSSWARAGAMLAPYIAAQGARTGGTLGRGVPLLVCGILLLCAGTLAIFLPETMGRKLPETVMDAKLFTKTRGSEPQPSKTEKGGCLQTPESTTTEI